LGAAGDNVVDHQDTQPVDGPDEREAAATAAAPTAGGQGAVVVGREALGEQWAEVDGAEEAAQFASQEFRPVCGRMAGRDGDHGVEVVIGPRGARGGRQPAGENTVGSVVVLGQKDSL